MLASMEAWQPVTLAGTIVRLEPLGPEHEAGLWEASRDPRTWEWLNIVQPGTRADWHELVEAALSAARAGTEIPFATIDLATGRIVGSTRFLALRPEHASVEIGWTWLHPSAWRTGVNVDAKLLMLRHAFVAWGCRRVELKTDARNERARAALEALGATFEGVHRKHMLVRGGANRDSAWYAIVDDEWPAVEERLRRRLERASGA
jgi:RimJ/RimL family protein N-acetyltransferase